MGHHNSTPQTILDAPKLRPEWLVKHTGPNRAERRRYIKHGTPAKLGRGRPGTRPRVVATNVPYRKPKEPA